mmetsp:Transcript_16064/g.27698  ORF Transcript_16064/g.27698 Transcript_16064/m.27698 type:complete len:619 (-) Transcript_16064:380-2236(-)|eukprot:CAMPEP_0196664206 /NCGR_PEP_ID=MMETSP1086-20130531/56140_1 /TAXON_ID=77921 /ORGANISM="Cyanoptyche  gloeocystis , Strain SAG4.97" /LENGTH=618 /DNA_ID=CAMNT_0042000403 /DNA_START=56 /DNA_END=1912 /DNA_ORIENTATION=-
MKLGPDIHSFANYDEVRVTALDLRLAADMSRKRFFGHVDISVLVEAEKSVHLILDTKALAIENCVYLSSETSGVSVQYTQPIHHPVLGIALYLPIPEDRQVQGSECKFRIYYSTTARSEGIVWMEPHQTLGKKHPFVFTQCEAILARTLFPCQDTPAVKCPCTISVTVPSPLVAVCSGIAQSDPPYVFEADGSLTFSYAQPQPIPAYLVSIGIGNLQKAAIGPRSSIWAEPQLLTAAVHEFEHHTEQFLKAAEEVAGMGYDWGVYDMLVLPSSFPYGGMENPNITFLSSSLIAGDRSMVNVIAHEICHSWAGNYVTNSNWTDFWLNEGFDVYMERLVLGKVFGSYAYRDFESILGYYDLVRAVQEYESVWPEATKLQPDLEDRDPDEAFSKVPYEKGSLLLRYLETLVGGPEAMQAWLKAYFSAFRGKSVSVAQMKQHLLQFFRDVPAIQSVDWNVWLLQPGLPPFDPRTLYDLSLTTAPADLAHKWHHHPPIEDALAADVAEMLPKQVMYFLDVLMQTALPLPHATLDAMERAYGFSSAPNVEIAFRWFLICIKSNYTQIIPQVRVFLSKHGRGLYVKPLYKALIAHDLALAKDIYAPNRSFYAAVIRNVFDATLHS